MATEATVTIKVSTSEWELIQEALNASKNVWMDANKNLEYDASARSAARDKAGRYIDLLRRLS